MGDRVTQESGTPGATIDKTDVNWGFAIWKVELHGSGLGMFYLTVDGGRTGGGMFNPGKCPLVEVIAQDPGDDRSFNNIHSSGGVFKGDNGEWLPGQGEYRFTVRYDTINSNWRVWIAVGGGPVENDTPDDGAKRILWIQVTGVTY